MEFINFLWLNWDQYLALSHLCITCDVDSGIDPIENGPPNHYEMQLVISKDVLHST